MRLGYTIAPGRGETNLLLAEIAGQLAARGVRIVGTVQIDTDRSDGHKCDMDVQVLPEGKIIRISQDLGTASRGCRLNAEALETAVADTEAALVEGADLLLINKFGKHEAEGRGFRGVIAEALARDIPVLAGVNKLNHVAFLDFCGEQAEELPANTAALKTWLDEVLGTTDPDRQPGGVHSK
ncbi:DUF2478 domain-containing protein (plasmid) [Aliiroseovarius sp. M344]|uniref:DUF2478 domain-containing protein n=1 Tax=Aliiroseovarius sp. M344 TaxID=2867010 RepID=UPI0021AD774D|nr:DUF2478 domain-containing protein [Aliiroseovarius sp. M344]UWQ16019.1 DUF2478 domain-containing protein [Aliiroseovarius sp. M344]